ncbi:Armadillo-type fold containing protein [Parasponia andersonii]|uniref:Armadillo-type fold containing protein n=1 Tax=Parasponia andersonii TaxID=3476 RepID=A0A2P5C881_PARAD|nr:Armadillo-type fold containing protein [Parasponia andersonii]
MSCSTSEPMSPSKPMSPSEFEAWLRKQLRIGGTLLLNPPSSTEELLHILDKVEELLSNVEQSPPTLVQRALLPTMEALISIELLRHSNMDLKVSVVSCITQVMRITAPECPYDDECMKEIFQLTLAAFEKLSLRSGRCYTKAGCILDVFSKIRSSMMMLDLDCHELVLEMFQIFLDYIRSDHPPRIFSAMEAIMTVTLDESEDIPFDLLSLLLSSVRKENQNISPVSSKLGENVITMCATKLESYLKKAVDLMGIDTNDYAQIVSSIYQSGTENSDLEDNLETEELEPDAVSPRKAHQTEDGIIRSISECTASTRKDDNVTNKNPSQKLQRGRNTKYPKSADSRDIAEPSSSLSPKTDKSKTKPDSFGKKRAPTSLLSTEEDHSKGADSRVITEPSGSLSIKAEKLESEPFSLPKRKGQMRSSLKNPDEGHHRTGKSGVIAEPKSSLSIKVDKTEIDPNTVPKKRGLKSSSLMDSEEATLERANSTGTFVPNTSISTKIEKSESELDSLPKKRGRKPNSLMNPEEGYDHSWITSGKKNLGPAHHGTSKGKSTESSASRNSVSKKGIASSTLEKVTEPAVLQSELDENTRASPSKTHNLPEAVCRKRGRLKRNGSTLNQEADTRSLSVIKVELVSSQIEGKSPKPVDLKLKKEPADTSILEEKEQDSAKLGLAAKENEETDVASGHMVARKETKVSCHSEGKLQQQSTMKLEAANVVDHSSVPRATRKRKRVSSSSSNDTNEESSLKNVSYESGIKSSNGVESYREKSTEIIRKKKSIIGKELASETSGLGELFLVGRRIKVWWPMDKKFYEGVVDSYDPIKKRHQVFYVDGDIETLNLKRQRWELVQHDASADEEKKTGLSGPDASAPNDSQMGKHATEMDQEREVKNLVQVKQEQADSPGRSKPQKGIQRTRSVKVKQANNSDQADPSSKRTRRGKHRKQNQSWLRKKKSEKSEQAKADPSSECSTYFSNLQQIIQKANSDGRNQSKKSDEVKPDSSVEKQAKTSDEVKQLNGDSSSERNEMPAPVFTIKSMSDTKSVNDPSFEHPEIKDEHVDATTRTDEGPNDDDQISAGNLEADKLKSTSDCIKVTLETVALSKGKRPEADTEFSSEECVNKLVEMSKGVKSEKTMVT